ncbi:MAG: hypothetical protein R3C40_00320 [Parvularculaceae bacterium]
MKLYSADVGEVVNIERIEQNGSVLMVHGTIMGHLPLAAELRPQEARKVFSLLNLKTIFFLLTFLFRKPVRDNEQGQS